MRHFNPGAAIIVGTIVLSICAAVFGFSRKGPPPEWVEIGENETGTMVYDRASLGRTGRGTVSVRIRHILSAEMMAVIAESLPGSPWPTHWESLDKIDCRKWEYSQANLTFRDGNFNAVNTGGKYKIGDNVGFMPIPPNTFVDALASEVCLPSDIEVPKGGSSDRENPAAAEGRSHGDSIASEERYEELAKLEAQGDLMGMIAYCQVWTMAEPKNAAAWNSLGWAYAVSGETGKAVVYFRKGLELHPGDKSTWFNLGLAYMQLRRPEKAAESYEKCVGIDPDYADAWYNLGVTYKVAGREEKVMTAYHELKRINPAKAEKFYENVVTVQ